MRAHRVHRCTYVIAYNKMSLEPNIWIMFVCFHSFKRVEIFLWDQPFSLYDLKTEMSEADVLK